MNNKWIDNEQDLHLVKQLFNNNDSPRTLQHLKWQYIESYSQKGRLILGGVDPSLINGLTGIYAVFQNRFMSNGKVVTGSQSLDTLVAPEGRGKGLFNKLASQVYKEAEDRNIAFVYGFPNGNSAHGFFNKLEWINLDPIPFLVLPLRSQYILSKLPIINKVSSFLPNITYLKRIKHKGNLNIVKNIDIDSNYDKLWQTFSKKINIGLVRDAEYINWRLSRPEEDYQNIAICNSAGEMQAICIYSLKEKHGGLIGYIMELIYLEDKLGSIVLNKALQYLKNNNCDAVLAWNFDHSPNHAAYKANGFLPLPEKVRPIELHFGVRVFNKELKNILKDRNNWYLSYFDSDTV